MVADALFREARDLVQAGKIAQACPKFAESYRLDPAPGTLYNLAECEEKDGKIASSLERWRTLIDLLTSSNKLTDPRLPVARQHTAELTRRVPRLVLRIKAGAPRETVVLYDGVELRAASLNTELPIEPGAHTVLARAAYRHDGEFKIVVKESELKELIVEPGGPDDTAPRPAGSGAGASSAGPQVAGAPGGSGAPAAGSIDLLSPPPSMRRTAGLVVGGVGVAALVGAGVTGLMLNNRRDTISERCNPVTKQCDSEGLDAAQSGKTLVPLNLGLWIAGVVGAGAGAYLFFTSPSGASAQVGAGTTGSSSSLWVSGRF